MIRVIIESPYGSLDPARIEFNVAYARRAMHHSLSLGEAPIASHLLYTQPGILRDEVPLERQWGIDAGLAWLEVCQNQVFYTDLGWSNGMEAAWRAGRRRCRQLYRGLDNEPLLPPWL